MSGVHYDPDKAELVIPESHETQRRLKVSESGLSSAERAKRVFAWVMIVVAVGESAFLFIQAGKIFRSKEGNDIDPVAFGLLIFANVLWFLYGMIVLKDIALTLSGLFYVIGAVLVLIGFGLYGDKPVPSCS